MIHLSFQFKKILGSALLISLCGCATTASQWQADSNQKIDTELKQAKDQFSLDNKAIFENWSSELLPPLKIDLANQKVASPVERFNVAVNKGKASDVYLNLVKGTKYGIILDPSITGKISLKLKNVTLDEVFDYIENAYGYNYEKNETHYIISGNKPITQIFQVDYINLVRGGNSSTSVTTGGLQEDGQAGVEIKTKSEVDFWKDLAEDLKAIVGEEDGHRITINQQSGIILAKARPKEVRLIAEYLRQIQSSITRQVILETKLLEVELSDGYQTGINWGQLFSRGGNTLSVNQVGGDTVLQGSNVSGIVGSSTTNISSSAINGGIASAFGGVFSMALQTSNFGAFIEMMSTQGSVHVLSSPRIATLNNQKAMIKVGGEEFYVTGVELSSRTYSPNAAATADPIPSVTMEPFFSGISLDVTPQIGNDGEITLHLHPTVSDVAQKNKTFVIYGYNFDLPLATSSVRETDSIVRTTSGQIIVVGGLMKKSDSEVDASVPLLGKMPLIGRLFRQNKASRVKKELVVLVKATLVNNDSSWSNEAASSMMRFSELRN